MSASTRREEPAQPGGCERVSVVCTRTSGSAASSSRYSTSSQARADTSSRASTSLPCAARWRSIAINGTSPEPPATSSSGPPSLVRQVKWPPTGPRTSNSSPAPTTPARYGETSPSSICSTVSSSRSLLGRRGDRVGALGLVAVLGGQAHVEMLAGDMAGPAVDVEHERHGRRRLVDDLAHAREMPDDLRAGDGQSFQYRCSRHGSPWLW